MTGHAGSAISTCRTALGLTRSELARRADVDRSYLSLVEHGERTPSPRWLWKVTTTLAEALAA